MKIDNEVSQHHQWFTVKRAAGLPDMQVDARARPQDDAYEVLLDQVPWFRCREASCLTTWAESKVWRQTETQTALLMDLDSGSTFGHRFYLRKSGMVDNHATVLSLGHNGLGLCMVANPRRDALGATRLRVLCRLSYNWLTAELQPEDGCLLALLKRYRELRTQLDNRKTGKGDPRNTYDVCAPLLKLDPEATVEQWMGVEAYKRACELHVLEGLQKL